MKTILDFKKSSGDSFVRSLGKEAESEEAAQPSEEDEEEEGVLRSQAVGASMKSWCEAVWELLNSP